MLLIYTHKITPRFSYVMRHIFTRILGVEVVYTTKVEDFIGHNGPRITYTKHPLQNEFFVRSNDLLFEEGINDIQLSLGEWEGIPCFFATGGKSVLPYDIFSASFYLLSRYEEYLPHMKDMHGRFPPKESVGFKLDFLRYPVVDLWAFKMYGLLRERFPELPLPNRQYQHISLIDVTSSHCYALRGPVRAVSGLVLDFVRLQWRRVWERLKVWVGAEQDPYDNFEALIALHRQWEVSSIFFFQFAEYSTFDKNISTSSNRFQHLIKSVADYSKVSLAASYSSFRDIDLLKEEKRRLSDVIHRPVSSARMRYNRVDVPDTYRNLVEAEFMEDYTMGYTHEIGFRAGTCFPFQFYDIDMEGVQPIRVHPFAVHDYALVSSPGKESALQAIREVRERVQEVQGDFITVFSNELLGQQGKVDWMDLYKSMLSES